MSRRRDDDPLARYVVEDKNEAVQAKSREVEVMHEEIAARRKARAEVAMLARRKAAAEARERRRKERAKRRKTRQKQLRRKERDKRKRAARREREKARAKAARAKARAQLIADGMLEEDPDNLDLDENSVVSLPNSEDDAQSDSPSVLSEVSEDTPDDVEADEVADGDLPPGGDVEMGVLEDQKELPERERQERLRDSMLEDYFAEYKECSTKLPLSHKEGNVELQRLCVALRFIIDEVGVRDRFLEDRGRELEEGDTVAEGSMMAAISHNSVVKIGREKAQRKKAKKKRRTPKSKPNPKPSPQPIAEEGPREGGGEGEGPGPDDSDSSDMELVPTKAAEKITRRHGGTRGRTRVRRAKRHKPSPKFPDMNEAVIDPHDRVNKVEDESPIAAISQEEPKDADVNQSFRTLLGSRRGGAGASAAKLNTAFGRDYERYVDPGVNEAETERFYQIWEDCQLETLDPFAEEFEAQCYSRTCEFLSERCIQQQEFLRTQLQDDPAIGSFTTEDLQAALHEQFHWRLQNLLLDMRRMERNPTSYHRGGFLYRVDNILAMLLYRRKDAVDEEEEKRIAAEAEQARMDERERIIYYNYIAGFFSYHKGKAATVLGALASVIIFGSLLIIWGAWRNTALVNLDKGMFHLSQANSARARVIAEDYVLQADAIRHHILSEFPRLQSSPRNMFETQAGDQGIGVPQGSETPSTFTNDPDGIIDRFLVDIVKRYNVKSVFAGVDTFEEHFICVRRIGTSTPTDSAPFDNSRLRVFATQVDDTTYSRDTTANLEEFSVDASGQRITGPGESFITSIDFNPFDLSHREWFPREVYGVSPSTKGHWTKPLGFFLDNTATSAFADEANDKPSIMYSFMVFGENGVQAGVFGVELWLPDLSAHLSEVDVFGTGAAYIAAPIVAASGDSISSWNMIASSVGQYDTTISLESRTGVPTATSSASSSGASRTTVQLLRSEIKTMDKYDSRVNNRDITYETKHDDDVFYVFSRAFDPRRAKEIGDASLLGCSRVPVDPNDAQVQMCLENWAIVTTVPQDDYLELIFTNTVLSFFIGCGAVATGFLTTKFSHRLIVLTQGLPTGGGKKQRTKKRKKKRKKKIVIDEDSLANGDSNGAPSLKQVEASSSESSSSSESEASFSYSESDESEDEAAAAAGGAKKKKKMVRKLRRMNSGRLVDMNQLKQVNAALIFCFLALVGSMLLVWALWNRTSNVQVKEIVDDLISETGERFSAEVRMPLALPTQILASVENAFSQPHAVSTESHDRLLFHLAVPFLGSNVGDARTIVRDTFVTRASDGQHSSISVYNPQTSPTSDHMPTYSVGFRNGSVASNDTTLAFRFSTRSADNSYCYTEYAMKPTGNPSRLDTLVRDESRVLFQSPACLYDARTETWFKRAVANSGQFVWSDPYIELDDLGEKTIMLTLSQSFQNATNATFVAGVHVAMPFMNEYLRRLRLEVGRAISDEPGANADPQAFILQRSADPAKQSGLVMASYSVHDHAKTRLDGLFRGTASNNDVTFSASKFFAQRPGGLLGLTKDQERVDRPLDDPITVLTLLDDCCSLPQFVVVINLPFEDYFAEFDRVFVLSFLLSLGIVICTIFVFKVAFTSFRSRILNKDDFRDILAEQKVLDEMSASVVPKKILLKLMRRIRKTVIEACAHQWRRRVWKRKQSLHPVHFDEVREHYALQAIRHINNSRDGRNILTLADLDSRGQDLSIEYDRTHDNRWPSRIYRVYSSVAYRLFIHGVIVLHIALFFQEPDTYQDLRDHGASSFVLSVEFLCLCAEFVDVVLRIVTTYHLKTRNFLSPPITVQTDIAYVVIYVLIAIDWGCTVLFDFSFEYLFPLRPLLLLMRNDSVRAAAYHFLRTIFYARNVFLLYLCIIVAGASMGTLLFRNTIVTNGPESSYENFIRSLTTTFVFVSTGENYTEIVYPAYRRSRLYILYFVTFCLFGMFFVLAMVIGMFQDGFQEQRRAQQRREQLFNRVGTVAAFVLMDLDGSEGLSKHEFQDFVMTLRPDITPTVTEQLFKRVDESGDDGIDVQEFVAGVEDILFERLILERNVAALSPWRVKFRLLVFEAEWVDFLVLLAVLVNVWLLSLYGTLKSERLMDTQGFFLLLFFVLEIGLKIWCYGWEEFWNYARYNGPKQAEQEEEQLVVDASSAAGKRMLEQQNRDRGSSDSSMNVDAQSEFGDGSSDAADGDDADSGDKPQSGLRSLLKRDEPREDEIAEQWSSKFGYSRPNREDPMREWRRAREAEREKQPDPDDQAMFPDASSSEEEDPRVQLRQEDELYRNEENIYRMYSNRVDFIIIAMSLFMAIVARIRVNSFTFDGHDSWRFVMTFPVLRLFTQIKRLRKLVFTLLKLFPRIASILVVVAVVFLLYGVIGVFYLHDAYEDLQDDAPEGNFTKLSEALLTLFQLLVGEGWQEVMYAAVKAKRGFGVSYYFISFVCVNTLLFVNVFIGIVLSSFSELFKRDRRKRVALQQSRLKRLIRANTFRDREERARVG